MTSQFADMTSLSIFFEVVLFLSSSLVTGPRFMSMSSLVLELWQFSFLRDWPEIWKSEIPPNEFCPVSEDWGELGILNLAQMSLMKCYWMLQNARVTTFTVFELLRKNKTGEGVELPPLPPSPLNQIRVKAVSYFCKKFQIWWIPMEKVYRKHALNTSAIHLLKACVRYFFNKFLFFTKW